MGRVNTWMGTFSELMIYISSVLYRVSIPRDAQIAIHWDSYGMIRQPSSRADKSAYSTTLFGHLYYIRKR